MTNRMINNTYSLLILLVSVIVVAVLPSCTKDRASDIRRADDFYNNGKIKECLLVLDSINPQRINREDGAHYGYLKSKALFRSGVNVSDSLISNSIKYFRVKNKNDMYAKSLGHLAEIQLVCLKDPAKALNTINLAIANKSDSLSEKETGLLYYLKASIYEQSKIIDSSLFYCNLAKSDFLQSGDLKMAFASVAKAYKQICFSKPTLAIHYYDEARTLADSLKDSLTYSKFYILNYLHHQQLNQLSTAEKALRKGASYQKKLSGEYLIYFSELYYYKGKLDSSYYYRNLLPVKGLRDSLQKVHFILSLTSQTRDVEKMNSLLPVYLKLQTLLSAESLEAEVKKINELWRLKTEQYRMFIYFILISLGLVVAILILYIIKVRNKHKMQEYEINLEQTLGLVQKLRGNMDMLSTKIELSQANLSMQQAQMVARQSDILKECTKIILSINMADIPAKGSRAALFLKDVEKAMSQIKNIYGIDPQNPTDIFSYVDYLYNNLTKRLKLQVPSLTNSEILMICMIKLGYTVSDIVMLTGYPKQSVYNRRNDISKKLQLSSASEIEEYISTVFL